MNLFKPKRTLESVVRELIAGLEDGSIVLGKEEKTSQTENQNGALPDQAQQIRPHTAPKTPHPGGSSQR
jgi:hypothetical protein